MKTLLALAMLALGSAAIAFAQTPNAANVIKDGSTVSLEYTLTGDDGKVIDTNKGKEPLRYVDGQDQIIPGLEKALEGLSAGAEKKVTVKPEDGYGAVDPKNFQEVPKNTVPADSLKVGTTLAAQTPDGQQFPVRIHEIKESTVIIDMNHPLAGKTLVFDVKILDVKAPEGTSTPPPTGAPLQQ
ncbi:MAG TPA: peptidylprolyl isomerase [Verrucomicrobiae bacterium]|jgi:FKBP-type peptidyl-prolyl cis-trans isomerase SlyD|nr:peptidylprolyl isomerase [Verrucomicrobiae bacterium]